ncbi:DUF2806 domain-containing protein [Cribrihabitans neustonicus]|uniref:DUF2806 domain-containing protein n=1 Tax=Cribrihabitans neustonicus TaxID=1429085 RepID=UPI003B58F457
MDQEQTNLPAQIADAIVAIPKGLTPGVVKALDRLVGAAVDVPVAWLHQKKAKIDAQTESYKLVERSIASSVASGASGDPEIAERAMNTLVRKEYRKQSNREAVAAAMVANLTEHSDEASGHNETPVSAAELDDDWLNLFERYAEDASSERLQGLWGKVLAGEIRRPGRFSPRTLRFLSEFSQADALTFEEFAKCAFGDLAPKSAVIKDPTANISHLVNLEASGLVQGASGLGLKKTFRFNDQGLVIFREGDLVIILSGEPGKECSFEVLILTPLAQEVLSLVGSRNAKESAKLVANAIRTPLIFEAHLGVIPNLDGSNGVRLMEVLWQKETPEAQIVEGTAS